MADGGPGVGGGGSLIFVARQTLVSDAQDITFVGLNGDVDNVYIIHADLTAGAGGVNQGLLLMNGLNTNQLWNYFLTFGALLVGSSGSGGLRISTVDTGGRNLSDTILKAKTGRVRVSRTKASRADDSPVIQNEDFGGVWNDKVTNITSIVVHSTVANGFGPGSSVTIYKMPRG